MNHHDLSLPMTHETVKSILLNGAVARRGLDLVHHHHDDNVKVNEITGDESDADRARKFADADVLVTVNFDLSAQGSDAGKTISALAEKKDLLVKAAKGLNIAVLRTSTSSLNVRSRSVRSFTADGNRTNKNVFEGKMGVLFTFKAGEDVLVNIGKIADDRVSSVSRMQFSFSQGEWEKQSADLKKRAMAKARANAEDQAEQQGRTLKNMTRSSFREPRCRTRNLQQLIDVQVTARVTYNVE